MSRPLYRDRHGHLASLPAAWTNVAAEDPFVVAAAKRSRLRLADLALLAALVRAPYVDAARATLPP